VITVGGVHAKMECVEPGCGDVLPVKLLLNNAGTLTPKFEGKTWQVLGDPRMPMGPIICRCPKHAQKLERPVIQSARVTLEGH
jgi:hypothetical protein